MNALRYDTDDVRIAVIRELVQPQDLQNALPVNDTVAATVSAARHAVHRILHGIDDRLIVVVGPCSIHDVAAAREYAARLVLLRNELLDDLEIVMRVYFEKPRTTVGWKGLVNDPDLDGRYNVNRGLRIARLLLLDLNELGMPAGTEFLDPIAPQYMSDLIAWGAIGARTTESQVHRELASGLSCPVGFKNGTDGNVKIAVDAIKAAQHPHCFLGVTKAGHSAIVQTRGNDDCHVILRGGSEPNYGRESVHGACEALARVGLSQKLMIDCSHANSRKQYQNQVTVANDVAGQLMDGDARIMGVMIESNLVEGRQEPDLDGGVAGLRYGQSITDACIGWDDTIRALHILAEGVRQRRCRLATEVPETATGVR